MESTRYLAITEEMKKRCYFRSKSEYEKTKKWVIKGTIPEWLKKDMKQYEESEEK